MTNNLAQLILGLRPEKNFSRVSLYWGWDEVVNNILHDTCYVIKAKGFTGRGLGLIMQFPQRGPLVSVITWGILAPEMVTVGAGAGCYLSGEKRMSSVSQAADWTLVRVGIHPPLIKCQDGGVISDIAL